MAKKKRTIDEIIKYHRGRGNSPEEYGVKFGDPKHTYSVGIRDELARLSQQDYYRANYGQKSAKAYAFGRAYARKMLRKKK